MGWLNDIYYEDTGAGPAVVFIHCPGLSHAYWRPTIDRLRDRCRCVAFDIRGHGRSHGREQPWRFTDIAADVTELTRSLGLTRPVLAGYSSGGCIALHATLAHPNEFGGVALAGGLSECSTLHLAAKIGLGLLALDLGLSRLVGQAIAASNSETAAHYGAQVGDAGRVTAQALRSFFVQTRDCRLTNRLWQMRLPALLAYGAKDDAMHKYYRLLRAGLPNSYAVMFRGAGHGVPTERPDAFADLLARFAADPAGMAVRSHS